ncbi:hypothetical protein CQ011_09985 [Arthrobacter sp. MYb213]|nr:hypothetical protein CQ011_09985 [Arthrobacter sp. MYb213]
MDIGKTNSKSPFKSFFSSNPVGEILSAAMLLRSMPTLTGPEMGMNTAQIAADYHKNGSQTVMENLGAERELRKTVTGQ